MAEIHSTAIVSSEATLAHDVKVDAYSIVGAGVIVGAGTTIGPFTRIEGPVTLGERNRIFGQSSIGTPPQDLKYKGERTELVIANDNVIREFVTINRGTASDDDITNIDSHNFFMAYSHVAHDCHIGSNTILPNNSPLGTHGAGRHFDPLGP